MKIRIKKRERKQARAWMLVNEIKAKDIQLALGMKCYSQVSETIHGYRNDRAVLRYLLSRGCPVPYLDLPKDMADEA